MATAFYGARIPAPPLPSPAWAAALLLRPQTLSTQFHASLPSLWLSPQPNAFPLSLSLHNLLILQGPTRMPHVLHIRSPEPAALVTCSSLHVLLTLHLCLLSASEAESTLGFSSWRTGWSIYFPAPRPHWGCLAPCGCSINICGLNKRGFVRAACKAWHLNTCRQITLCSWVGGDPWVVLFLLLIC